MKTARQWRMRLAGSAIPGKPRHGPPEAYRPSTRLLIVATAISIPPDVAELCATVRPLPPGWQRVPLVACDDLPQRAHPRDGETQGARPGRRGAMASPAQARARQLAGLVLGDQARMRMAGCDTGRVHP